MAASLVHSKVDPWLLGGLALAFSSIALAVYDPELPTEKIFLVMPWLLLGVSYPHFVASYLLFYKQPRILRRAWFTATVLPLLLMAILSLCVFLHLDHWLTILGQVGLGFLYWHYSKQSFGASLWLMHGEAQGRALPIPRRLLLLTCLSLGCSGYFNAVSQATVIQAFGMYLPPFDWPSSTAPIVQSVANTCFLLSIGVGVFQGYRQGSWSSLIFGAIPLVALWSWVEPSLQTPWLLMALPAFHGLQYLPFAFRVWRNESGGLHYWQMAQAIALTIGLGFVLFRWLPQNLTLRTSMSYPGLSLAPAAMLWLLNIHHYFIDGHMWRLKQPSVRERLLAPH